MSFVAWPLLRAGGPEEGCWLAHRLMPISRAHAFTSLVITSRSPGTKNHLQSKHKKLHCKQACIKCCFDGATARTRDNTQP